MREELNKIIEFSGLMFMIVSTIMFYNHLLTAAGNPGFFVVVYFNMLNEGIGELIAFILFVPFILFTVVSGFKRAFRKNRREKDNQNKQKAV